MFVLNSVQGIVTLGKLQPDSVTISGEFKCPPPAPTQPFSVQILINGMMQTVPTQIITVGGVTSHYASFTFSNLGVACGDTINFSVRGDCSGTGLWSAWEPHSGVVECPGCPRMSLQVSYGACAGSPPNQTQAVTLTATVMMRPGESDNFTWNYGDGSPLVPAGPVINTGGWSTPHTLTTTHNYAATPSASYTAQIFSRSTDCKPVTATVSPQCSASYCPTVTLTAGTPGPCVNSARSVTWTAQVGNVPTMFGAALAWQLPGSSTPVIAQGIFANGTYTQTVDYPASATQPTTYSNNAVSVTAPIGCGGSAPVPIVIDPCPSAPLCPPGSPLDSTIPKITEFPCDSAGSRPVTVTVKVNPGWAIASIDWSWDGGAASMRLPGLTSPSQVLSGGVTHTVVATAWLAPPNDQCHYSVSFDVPVTVCGTPPVTTPPVTTPPVTTPPVTTPPLTTPPPPPPSGFSWCCFLIVGWAIINAIFAVLLYFNLQSVWPVGTIVVIVVGAIATVLLVIWLFLCCWPCILKFWSCCELWQWQFISASWAATLLGVFRALCGWGVTFLCGPDPQQAQLVLGIYAGYVVALFALLSVIGSCGRLPNPFDPRTWPPCCCAGRPSPCP
jgi:hypothetical protein